MNEHVKQLRPKEDNEDEICPEYLQTFTHDPSFLIPSFSSFSGSIFFENVRNQSLTMTLKFVSNLLNLSEQNLTLGF